MDYRAQPDFQPHLASLPYGLGAGPLGPLPRGAAQDPEEPTSPRCHPVAVCQQESLSFTDLPTPATFDLFPFSTEDPARPSHWLLRPQGSPDRDHGLLWPLPIGDQNPGVPAGVGPRQGRADSWCPCPLARPTDPLPLGDSALDKFLGGPRSPRHPELQRRASRSSEKSAWRKMRVYHSEDTGGSPGSEDHVAFLEAGVEEPEPPAAPEVPKTLESVLPTPAREGTKEPERRRFSASELMNRLQFSQRRPTFSLRLGKALSAKAGPKERGAWPAREGKGLWKEQSCPEPSCPEPQGCGTVTPVTGAPGERQSSWPSPRPERLEEPAPNTWVPHERRQSRFLLNSVLYQEYSDVASDRELQRQKCEDAVAEEVEEEEEGGREEEEGPGPPRANLSPSSSFRAQRFSRSSTFSLWQDIPDVRGSGVLATISLHECKLQEAKFELITSEASYIHSLSVAVGHFLCSRELGECLGAQEKQWLFSKLPEVKDTSERFLQELEQQLERDVLRFEVCDIVLRHCPAFRRVYLPYLTNQAYQERTYQRLLLENPKFPGILARLEEAPICQRLPLTSFLILPFQRITRLKMLVENILKRTAQSSPGEDIATKAFNELKKLVQECNASVQSMKRTEELIHLNKKIHFESKIFPLISQSRWLVRHGELVELAPPLPPTATPTKLKLSRKAVYLHLFNDCLLLSRRKETGKFAVFVYAQVPELKVKDLSWKLQGVPGQIFLLQLFHSQQRIKHQLLLRAHTESEKQRWISALSPSSPEADKEYFSGREDSPQVQCIRAYKALQPDELTLEKADILAVKTKTSDGWLEGIRLADGERGWVPRAYVEEIVSFGARLRNLRENRRIKSATRKLEEETV
ncbi:rho guanine nucleotide exchange factor 19 [Tachyglossus aculeatus]|uniref:rho guanine nucleotide exchange factor 19 n=1 Tax=Tachyglossus aculeatus TaxID=9261 RepID=UPI0018F522DF|nr:rho guanine nucleotide exchange factor 19 [Tachyglossus aculeatus]